jgi:hypothetical protein
VGERRRRSPTGCLRTAAAVIRRQSCPATMCSTCGRCRRSVSVVRTRIAREIERKKNRARSYCCRDRAAGPFTVWCAPRRAGCAVRPRDRDDEVSALVLLSLRRSALFQSRRSLLFSLHFLSLLYRPYIEPVLRPSTGRPVVVPAVRGGEG